MSPSLRPWKPASFSTIPVQRTRALSAYVAQAASETSKVWYLEPMALTATGIVIFWLGWNAPFISRIGWFLEPLGAGCVLVALFQKFRLDRGEVSSDIRKVYLFRHLRKLDQSRRSVGLDLVLNPETEQRWLSKKVLLSSRRSRTAYLTESGKPTQPSSLEFTKEQWTKWGAS